MRSKQNWEEMWKIIKFSSITTTGHPRFETVRRSREKPEVYKWKIVNTTLGA